MESNTETLSPAQTQVNSQLDHFKNLKIDFLGGFWSFPIQFILNIATSQSEMLKLQTLLYHTPFEPISDLLLLLEKNAIFTITYTFRLRACPHWCPFPLIHNIPQCVFSVPWNIKLFPSPGPLNVLLLLPRTLFSPPSSSTDLVNFYFYFIFQLTYPAISSLTTTSLTPVHLLHSLNLICDFVFICMEPQSPIHHYMLSERSKCICFVNHSIFST